METISSSNNGNFNCRTGDYPSVQHQCLMRRHANNNNSSTNSSNGPAIKKNVPGQRSDEVVKRTRSMNVYELSQDLLDKQIELLERKYGGPGRANHAARVIQRAFRHYSMRRKFATITAMAKADQRRLSRRIHSELVDSAWAATSAAAVVAVNSSNNNNKSSAPSTEPDAEDSGSRAEYVIRTNFAALYRELAETVEGARSAVRQAPRPHQMRVSPHHLHFQPHYHMHQHHHYHVHSSTASAYGYQAQQFEVNQYHYQMSAGTPPPSAGPVVNCTPASPPVSHTPYGSHHHHHQLQQQHQVHQEQFRRTDSKVSGSGSKRVPPEVPRRVSSTLSTKSSASLAESPAIKSSLTSSGSRPQTPLGEPTGAARSNLSTEHSTSEDSLEGAGAYSNTFWCENGSSAPPHAPHVHSSPVPYTQQYAAVGGRSTGASHHERQAAPTTPTTLTTPNQATASQTKLLENVRKRQYRVGLNLFNKKPERGIAYLTERGFLEASPRAVAKFFVTRKGVSKQMIGEYLGNLQNAFNMAALDYFIEELDFAGLEIDVALRRFQTHFRMPGEAQKIERLMEVFGQRYCQCNPQVASRLRSPDTVFILAFAIIMLNTDLHTPSLKADKRMKLEDFVKNLRGIDDGSNVEHDLLAGIYERVKAAEFKPGADHVTQVLKVQQSIVGKKPNLVLAHRRLVCYCRLYEVADASRRERAGLHQREVFLFNDMLVVTKIFSKKKNGVTYSFRQSFQLAGLSVSYFESHHYPFGIRLTQRVDNRALIMFNARNEHDRAKFCEDLREAILEMDEMESLRIEAELDKQRSTTSRLSRTPNNNAQSTPAGAPADKPTDNRDNRDSGVADMDHSGCVSAPEDAALTTPLTRRASQSGRRDASAPGAAGRPEAATNLKRTTLSNSLLDMHDPVERYQRRGSVGSLDSGMSISFQSSTTNSTMSRDSSPKNLQAHPLPPPQQQQQLAAVAGRARGLQHQSSFLGNIFHKAGAVGRERKASHDTTNRYPTPHCTDV